MLIVHEAITIILFIVTVRSVLGTVKDYFKLSSSLKHIPIDSYIQVVMIFLWFIGIILILSVLTGRDIGTFLASLGALSAIIILVFRDTILGFVSSIQITVNDTVRIGDWITMKGSDADGTVIEVNLSTVKVQNFDNTITTIPTYKLVSDSFINWRGMEESKGRRIKRSLLIKPSSVKFLESDDIEKLNSDNYIKEFLIFTFGIINDDKIHEIASVFTFGREDLIPDMFIPLLEKINSSDKTRIDKLIYYFKRHIEVDGDMHGPMAMKMLSFLCGDDKVKINESIKASEDALRVRIALWDGIEKKILNNNK